MVGNLRAWIHPDQADLGIAAPDEPGLPGCWTIRCGRIGIGEGRPLDVREVHDDAGVDRGRDAPDRGNDAFAPVVFWPASAR